MLFHLKEATKHLNFLKIKKIVLILSTLCLFHCEKDISSIPSQQISEPLTQNKNLRIDVSNKETDEPLELGEKLINPYSINNMEKSLNILKEKKLAKSDFIVHINYLYVRILPENEEQFKLINSDPELDLFEYPLDYSIAKRGNEYKDPQIKNSDYTWLYCAVPTSKVFDKEINVQVLEQLFLPFGNGKNDTYSNNLKSLKEDEKDFLKLLEDESLSLTNNKSNSSKSGRISSFLPSGSVFHYDDSKNTNVPLIGCKVRANRWFTTNSTLTNYAGYFQFYQSYGGDVNYSIVWDRDNFQIWNGDLAQAYYNGPNSSSPWHLLIGSTPSKSRSYAIAHRAAYDFYFGNHRVSLGLPQPSNILIRVRDIDTQNDNAADFNPAIGMRLWTRVADVNVSGGYRNRSDLETYGTVAHEIGHRLHRDFGSNTYNANLIIAESWSEYIKYLFSTLEYGRWGSCQYTGTHPNRSAISYSNLFNFSNNRQNAVANNNGNSQSDYTTLMLDLTDNLDQEVFYSNNSLAKDRVNGYTTLQIMTALQNTGHYFAFRDYLKNNYNNSTEIHLDELFNEWYY
jgi:hypothetical protein